jgi:hypothetical protein
MAVSCQPCTLTDLSMGRTTITHWTVDWVDLRASLKVLVAFQKVIVQGWNSSTDLVCKSYDWTNIVWSPVMTVWWSSCTVESSHNSWNSTQTRWLYSIQYNFLYSQATCFNPNGSHWALMRVLDFDYQQSEMEQSNIWY